MFLSQMGVDRRPPHYPLGKVLSGWGSPTTARPSGRNRGCQARSPGEPDFCTTGWWSHARSVWCSLERAGSPVSQLTELLLCMSGTAQWHCPCHKRTCGVSGVAWSARMLKRCVWPVAHLDRSVLRILHGLHCHKVLWTGTVYPSECPKWRPGDRGCS